MKNNPFSDFGNFFAGTVDLKLAFSIWSEKQAFYAKLPENKKDKINISSEQILLLMAAAYEAGFNRAKL